MNRETLQKILDREGISRRAYYLDGGHPGQHYVLARNGLGWAVYYNERDEENERREFVTEDAACEYLLGLLRRDPTTRNP
jgi:hypothetical protein